MKIYLATPVNGRGEKTLLEKMQAAHKRIIKISGEIKSVFPQAEIVNSFDIPAVWNYCKTRLKILPPEAEIIGECVRMVLESDMVVMDDEWQNSRGCRVEEKAAIVYGKRVIYLIDGKL